jgi:3-(3-hydroxy-phenyl)propionate hydroxylase
VLRGEAPDTLLDTYDEERRAAADENILNSTRSTDFITPKSHVSRVFRDAVLDLAARHPFARPLVNSGRLSLPSVYDGLSLTGEDALPGGPARSRPGAPCPDAALGDGFLLDRLGGGFALLAVGAPDLTAVKSDLPVIHASPKDDPTGALADRYLGDAPHALYLIRPDQHVVARWADPDADAIATALARARGAA